MKGGIKENTRSLSGGRSHQKVTTRGAQRRLEQGTVRDPEARKVAVFWKGGQRRATLSRPRGDWNEVLGLRTCSSTFRSLVAAAYALETGLRRWRL